MRTPLNALRTFEAVASHLSFTKGAESLNVTPAAVSSQIRALEELLGQPLFLRKGRNIQLTDAGKSLLPGVKRGLTELRQALQTLQTEQSDGVLRVSMIPSFLQKWLTPRLTDFYRKERSFDLRLNADVTPVNFDESEFHAAIRFGRGHWPELKVKKLLDDWTIPVCSPGMLDRIGPVNNAEDLKKFHLIQGGDELWDSWFRALGGAGPHRRGPRFDDSVSISIAAEQGLGIALARWSLVSEELASGRLVRCLPLAVKSDFAYYFVAPHHYFDIPKVVEFRAWLERQSKAFAKPLDTV
jgi:LysR family glycine cleavage system transcriptional activator